MDEEIPKKVMEELKNVRRGGCEERTQKTRNNDGNKQGNRKRKDKG